MIFVRLAGDIRFPASCSYNTCPLLSSLRRMPWAGATRHGGNWCGAIAVRTGTELSPYVLRKGDGWSDGLGADQQETDKHPSSAGEKWLHDEISRSLLSS